MGDDACLSPVRPDNPDEDWGSTRILWVFVCGTGLCTRIGPSQPGWLRSAVPMSGLALPSRWFAYGGKPALDRHAGAAVAS